MIPDVLTISIPRLSGLHKLPTVTARTFTAQISLKSLFT